jgi:hypothetical protein
MGQNREVTEEMRISGLNSDFNFAIVVVINANKHELAWK